MSKVRKFSFIFGVIIAALAAIALILAYFYLIELPKINTKPYNLKAASIVAKIRPQSKISNLDDELVLYALKGQSALGQVVMQANKNIKEAEIRLEKLENQIGEGQIESENIQIGLEAYVETKAKSDPAADSIGKYPDPVIFDPKPFPLEEGKNQPLVLRITVSETASSGIYEGQIDGYFEKINETSLKVKLYVFDKKFPEKRILHTLAGMHKDSIRKYYSQIEDEKTLFSDLVVDGLKHGINIFGSELERPFGINTVDTKKLDFSKSDEYIEKWRAAGLNSLYIPGDDNFYVETYGQAKFLEYLKQIQQHYQEKNWLVDAYVFPISDPETEKSYKRVQELYQAIGENADKISRLLTEQVTPDNPSWPNLQNIVDIWLPQGEKYYQDFEALQRVRKAGAQTGFYTPGRYSGLEGYANPAAPSHSIDRAFNDLAFAGLEAYRNADTYHLIWNTTWWSETNPWQKTQTWKSGKGADGTTLAGNGTGYLYYPGDQISKFVQGQKDQKAKFVPSLRLLAMEEGLNLYEVAKLAKLPKSTVPKFKKISANSADLKYKVFLRKLYQNFKINREIPKLPKYKPTWQKTLQNFQLFK